MTPAIEVKHLSYAYDGGEDVFRDLSFTIVPGERVAIIGGNGAGKSTLLQLLAGLLKGRGEIRIFGEEPRRAGSDIGLVFQNPEDQLFMPTILDDVALPLINRGLAGADAQVKAKEALRDVGLDGCFGRPAHKLSNGQRKRAAIASVLALAPRILMLDEPTAELDGRSKRELQRALSAIDATQLLVTHDLDLAQSAADRVMLLSGDGDNVQEMRGDALLQNTSALRDAGLL